MLVALMTLHIRGDNSGAGSVVHYSSALHVSSEEVLRACLFAFYSFFFFLAPACSAMIARVCIESRKEREEEGGRQGWEWWWWRGRRR
jgi:hypothetical protein